MHLVIALLAAIAARQAHACSFEIASVTSTYLGKPWPNATIANNTYTPQQVVVGVRGMRGCYIRYILHRAMIMPLMCLTDPSC